MHIEYFVEGGLAYFPGLAKPNIIDTENLPPDEAEELHRLITAVDFFKLPSVVGKMSRGSADLQTNIISIKDGKKSKTVKIIDPITNPQIKDLLAKLKLLKK